MDKTMKFIQAKLTPIANFFGQQRHFAALQKGIMTTISFILVSAIFMIIANPPVTAELVAQGGFWSIFSGWLDFATTYKATILIPFNMTMGMISVIAAFAIAYHLANSYKMSALNNGLTSMILFFIAAAPANYLALANDTTMLAIDTTYLGSAGLFVAILVSLLSVEITRLCQKKNITIKMPEGIPPFLSEMFGSLIPLAINIFVFFGGNIIISLFNPALSIPTLIESIMRIPIAGVNSIPGALLVCFFVLFCWCVGVHGMMVVMPLVAPISIAAFASNAELVASGQAPIFHPIFMQLAITFIGGTGNTLPLVLLCLKARSKQLKVFGKAAIIPSIFRISEPVIFGAPIMFNPILMIPFIFGGLFSAVAFWLACTWKLLTPPYLLVTGTFPIFLDGFLKSLDYRYLIFTVFLIVVLLFIWYPFVKLYDSQLLAKEKERELNELNEAEDLQGATE
ncbi:PTS sugar transporter subunit IIC [Enterococcus thailandicus]|uniref:Permease IIC component n=1 Tax=Enterococcus thailandicus TaxID=417368 RepID=A0A510WFL6_ENTTH|nr:PTS transporter subunit EIIC [Enterococcus thailandicus]OJG93695.1 PTS lactose transporter subunit IIC [Enterococcus thailandicus]GEK37964.1 permease IIC component [Enterococcus thailandicus]